MLDEKDKEIITIIAERAAFLLSEEPSQEAASKEKALMYHQIMYEAAIAQSRCVTPPGGWDAYGR